MIDARDPSVSKRRRLLSGLAVVGVLAALLGYWHEHHEVGPHGKPDPGGVRLAAIRAIAPRMLPGAVTAVHVEQRGFRWDRQTCDGEAPGWSSAEVDMTFRASSSLPASLDSLMHRLHWRQDTPKRSASGPPPASPGSGFRDYVPTGRNSYDEEASLTPPSTYGGGLWDLDVSANPAEVPSHDC